MPTRKTGANTGRKSTRKTGAKTGAKTTRKPRQKTAAFIGLGDMGLHMAQNLLRAGFEVTGHDLSARRRNMFKAAGGRVAVSARDSATGADIAFIMVMNGAQVMEVIAGEDGLLRALKPGAVIVISATIERDEAKAAAEVAAAAGVLTVDAPVSGGLPGARDGLLTFMAAGVPAAIRKARPALRVLGKTIHVVGDSPGDGQTVKAALQAMLGSMFTAIFEAMTLGKKARISDAVLFDVLTTSIAASPMLENCAKLIVARRFKNTGSSIKTMHKDLGITANLAREVGAPLPVASAARELFQAGIASFPGEDNWCVVKVLERMAGLDGGKR